MKKIKWLTTVLIVASIALGIIGCSGPSVPIVPQGVVVPEGFVLIPAGTFQMGSNEGYSNNKPVHEVTITKPFYMGKYEVTQAEYEKYCSYGSDSPSSSYGDGDNYPAYYVSWYDALVYCNKRSIAEGLTPCYSIKGSTDPKDKAAKDELYRLGQKLAATFKAQHGSYICKELLGLVPMGTNKSFLTEDAVINKEGSVSDERTEEYYKKRPCPKLCGDSAAIFAEFLKGLDNEYP